MTNYHCVPGILEIPEIRELGATRIEAVQLILGYTQEGVDEPGRRYTVSPAPLEENKALDYAILEVFGEPGAAFGQLRIATAEPFENAPLWIIGHPLGEAQRISREQCKSGNPVLSGGRLLHTCDTLPGNSGSPVIDPDSREVIALHHAGSKRNSVNYAIPAAAIVEQSPILQELMKQNGEKVAVGIAEQPPTAPAQPACDGVEVSLGTGGTECIKPGRARASRIAPSVRRWSWFRRGAS